MDNETTSAATGDAVRSLLEATKTWIAAMPRVADAEATSELYVREREVLQTVGAMSPADYGVLAPHIGPGGLTLPILRGLSASRPADAAEWLVREAEEGRPDPLRYYAENIAYGQMDELRRELAARVARVKRANAKAEGLAGRAIKRLVKSLEGLTPKELEALRAGPRAGRDAAFNTFASSARPLFDKKLEQVVPELIAALRTANLTAAGRSRAWGSAVSALADACKLIDVDPAFFLEIRATAPDSNEAENAFIGLKNIARRLEANGRAADAAALRAKLA